ncbi:DNA independent RNA polymerase I transcription factor [Mactra antiquata]
MSEFICSEWLRSSECIYGMCHLDILYMFLLFQTVQWTNRSSQVVHLYQSTVVNIVSVHTVYLRSCIRQLIKLFIPDVPKKDGNSMEVEIDEEAIVKHNTRFSHVHTLIKTIAKLVPMASKEVHTLLIDNYPYMTKSVYILECYLKNALQITFYLPELRVQILELVIERVIKIDVHAPRLTILAIEEQNETQESGIFCMDDTDPVTEMSRKLDVLMIQLFEYINVICVKNGELDWEATKQLYRELLLVFEKVILPTYACCHVQFVMFYLVSLKMPLCDGFLDYLWKIVQNPNAHSVHRQSAVAYMGSLLARAKFISTRTVMKTLELMVEWAHNYTKMCQDCLMADISRHGPFYSVCQSIFYTFAFRQKELLETKTGLKWASTLQFQHLIHSRLNPLKVCLPIIVKTFASVARQHQLAFCDHIIEQNNRSFLPVEKGCIKNILDTYFPFDPYLLKVSSKYITPLYQEYENNDFHDESSGEEDEDEMFTEDVSSNNEISMTTESIGGKGQLDLMQYGTSPGFQHMC